MDKHRPTFPLPPEEIRKEKIRAFLTSKQVWIPFFALLAIGIFVEAPVWALVPLLILAFFVLALAWQARSGRILGKISERIIRKSNHQQDEALVERIRDFSSSGDDGYAVTLGKFLEAKQSIEARLHPEGKATTASGEAIEELVDSISIGVADQFDAVIALEKQIRSLEANRPDDLRLLRSRQKEHLTRVIEAYKATKSALLELDFIVRSARPETAEIASIDSEINEMDARIARLKEETRIAVEGQIRATFDVP